ncbi:two component transcriptional regulator, LuxR family [Sinomicrobium oceani]|uniref:Two component transcriptional regulator, LuxR family n=2 Tax=Sinomicrobium oceani TaxID=1150368 RepID=A0A1K1QU04_9FLAO|nr:two component transcriptional regulator, LuxR family [Sinomicrobium oceani]
MEKHEAPRIPFNLHNPQTMTIKIALADDEELFLEGLTRLLSVSKEITVTTTAEDGTALLRKLSEIEEGQFPEIVLADIQMQPMNGFELVEQLRKYYPDLRIIILSSHYRNAVFGQMIKLGVSAFLPKNSTRESLLNAIRSVHETGVYFSPGDHRMLLEYVKDKPKKHSIISSDELSEREIEVVKLICSELTNQEIGDKLYISKRTVESHRQRILEKIGARNTVGLVIYAIAHEIIPPSPYLGSV